jgi:hypothetical protein
VDVPYQISLNDEILHLMYDELHSKDP